MTSGDQVSGQVGGSLDFDGTNDLIGVGDAPVLEPVGDMTVAAWVKLDRLPSISERAEFVYKQHSVSPFLSYKLQINDSDNPEFLWRNTAGTTFTSWSTDPLSVDTWYYIVGVGESTEGTAPSVIKLALAPPHLLTQESCLPPVLPSLGHPRAQKRAARSDDREARP